jgi:hypothetical protein
MSLIGLRSFLWYDLVVVNMRKDAKWHQPTNKRGSKMAKSVNSKKQSTDNLFEQLAQTAAPVETKGKGKKKDKPQIDLNEAEQKAFESFCASDVIFKMAEGKQKASKSLVLPVLRRKLLEKWLAHGSKTDNPVVITEKARANFVVRDILKIDLPEKEDGTPGTVKDRLLDAGFDEDEASTICDREFKERVEMNFRPLNDLRTGDPGEQKAVNKLLKLVLENFSTDEQRLLLRRETKVEVTDGFLDRAPHHAGDSIEKLDALLTVIAPQWVLSHMTYSGKDLTQAVADLTGGELPIVNTPVKPQEFFSQDREWKAVAKGNEASLYKLNGDGETFLGTKKCNGGADHAVMTAKKWLRDADYRATSMVEFATKK